MLKSLCFAIIVTSVVSLTSCAILRQYWRPSIQQQLFGDGIPRVTGTQHGHPGDPLNVGLVGIEADIDRVMKASTWITAVPLSLKNDFRIGLDTVLDRPFDDAPVSELFLFGRHEDLAFEQQVGHSPRHRHHVRLWRSEVTSEDGRPIWIGAATYDASVGFSHVNGTITHHTASDIDSERNYIFDCIEKAKGFTKTHKIDGFHVKLVGRNGGGDPWQTDGALWVGELTGK